MSRDIEGGVLMTLPGQSDVTCVHATEECTVVLSREEAQAIIPAARNAGAPLSREHVLPTALSKLETFR